MATSFPTSLDSLTNPLSTDALNSPSHSGQHADANDAIEALQAKVGVNGSAVTTSHDYKIAQLETNSATLSGTQTLTNKTLTAPVINNAILNGTEERWGVSSTALTGTVNYDVLTSSAQLVTTAPSANWTLNIRGNSGTTFDSLVAVNDSMTVVLTTAQSTTVGSAWVQTDFQIDGSAVTVVWQGGQAPVANSLSFTGAWNAYTFTIIKTAASTYTVLGSIVRYN